MSLTKRWIDDLMEAAQNGDEEAQETLKDAGLWASEEELKRAEEDYYFSIDESEPVTMDDVFEFGF